jgi:2',3'-cyclic-nucleotide 2'-phosphodiesterase (5'-nucleotidase family)
LLVDGGDEMQGSLLSNLQKGVPTIAAFNATGYDVATFGNHEFDWGQAVLISRTGEAHYPFVTANIVQGTCDPNNWTPPSFAQPFVVKTLNTTTGTVRVAFIGVTTTETPIITIASATAGLCFKDPTDAILHYYDAMKAQSDVIVVLSHLGYTDGGYGYGIPVYGDQTLANNLIKAGKPVPLIIGGHSHTDLGPLVQSVPPVSPTPTPPSFTVVGGKTSVVQAYYNGRRVGRADIAWDTATGSVTVTWQGLIVSPAGAVDAAVDTVIKGYANDPAYLTQKNQPIGYTQVDLLRNYNGDNMMGDFVDDAIYESLNNDATPANDVDMFFNNPGGIRTDLCAKADPNNPGSYVWSTNAADCTVSGVWSHAPMLLTYGDMFSILPFGNATVVGNLTGAQILEVLNQAATLGKGAIQPAGLHYKFFNYKKVDPLAPPATPPTTRTYAWGAFDACVVNKGTHACDPLDLNKTYSVGTNEFLAPAGGDNFLGFKYMTNVTYWGDMLNAVDNWVSTVNTSANPYKGPSGDGSLDGRIARDGNDNAGSIIPITILHNNDSHGNLAKGAFVGYTQLATLINQERYYNPDRTLLLNGGDQIQGDAMMYYFKSAALGYAADGTPLPPELTTHPMMALMNYLKYDAMTLGNHEFNFGSSIFTSVFGQANFPILGANVSSASPDVYGLSQIPVQPYVEFTLGPEQIKVAVLGITNHRVPNYELPSNIPGLAFSNPVSTAQGLVPTLRAADDVVVALTHIGFTTNPKSVEVDNNVDTYLANQVDGIDAIVGSHSHTDPSKQTDYSGAYKYLPTIVSSPTGAPVLITQAYRYNNYLGEVIIGVRPNGAGGFDVVTRAGQYFAVTLNTAEDPGAKAIVDPYVTALNAYNNKVVGQTTVPIDTMQAFTQETNGANLQADASVWELGQHGITVDFHLSGAMTNKLMAAGATPASPVTLKISDMFSGMPYENSLVVMSMNGPQLKAVLERAYRNYFYYKYVSGYGGYSYYTTCMIDTDKHAKITYNDLLPALPNGNNVVSLQVDGQDVDFTDASTYYTVSTVNYLAAGSCNFNDNGVSLWPLNQIVHDTQFYVRDAVIDYIDFKDIVSPAIEGRLAFITDTQSPVIAKTILGAQYNDGAITFVTSATTLRISVTDTPAGVAGCAITAAGPGGTTSYACQAGDNDIALTGPDGSYLITVTAVDKAGNQGVFTETDLLDNSTPAFGACPTGGPFAYNTGTQAVGPIAVSDATGSGVDLGASVLMGNVDTVSVGVKLVTFTAVDNLGNAATPKVCQYEVTVKAAFQKVLADLKTLKAGVTDKQDRMKLDQAIAALGAALDPAFWQDGNHLKSLKGELVYFNTMVAVDRLEDLLKQKHSTVPAAPLKIFISRLVDGDRVLAAVAIQDAVDNHGNPVMIAMAKNEIARGNQDAVYGRYEQAITHYQAAWTFANLATKFHGR